jgi:hypothetical protein
MAWSIFTQGGGKGAAKTWATDLLKKIGAPLTAGNEQMIYDWEVSEGGGGKYNPLNQGPVPGDPSLTTTGSQYGGGAADYASWDAGLQGAADYLGMPSFTGIENALVNSDPQSARNALIASPWAASHYGGGSAFSDEALPGQASALAPDGGGTTSSAGGSGLDLNPLSGITSTIQEAAVLVPILLGAAAIGAYGIIKASGANTKIRQEASTLTTQGAGAAAVAL